ncbi:MAG: 4-hydroxybenzoate 3-monooxygenase [Pseudomonadota bacterium]
MKTQVAIIGAGPAGLLLAQMLKNADIECVVLEHRSRAYVLERIRAGVLEPGTVDTLTEHGVADRLHREAIPHQQMMLRWDNRVHVLKDFHINGRRSVTYGQSEIVKDLIERHELDGLTIHWETEVTAIDNLIDGPEVHFVNDGQANSVSANFVAGCDGYRGVSRTTIPGVEDHCVVNEYPFAWLGILAQAPPKPTIRGYAHHVSGAAIGSARSKDIGRLYLQVPRDTNIDDWSDRRIWDELDRRFEDGSGEQLNRGEILQKDLALLRGFICKKMQYGRLFLAGDAAHIVPPSGAKGLNLAVGDVRVMFEAIRRYLETGATELIENYSDICLRRIYPMVHWANRLCETLHVFPNQTSFQTRMQYETLRQWFYTENGQHEFIRSMLGAPYEY